MMIFNLEKKRAVIFSLLISLFIGLNGAYGQNRSISDYRQAHKQLLANQTNINRQLNNEASTRYTRDLYGEVDPAHQIYKEGWSNEDLNPYKNMNVPTTKVITLGKATMPVKWNVITSRFGYRARFGRMHRGVDLKANVGDTIYAAFDGKIRLTKFERGGYGFYVVVRHENGLETVYAHLSRYLCKPDQYVKAGTPIALSGNTGRSTGPHLHFETRYMGYAINPEWIFDFEQRRLSAATYTFNKNEVAASNNNHRPTQIQRYAKGGGKKTRKRK